MNHHCKKPVTGVSETVFSETPFLMFLLGRFSKVLLGNFPRFPLVLQCQLQSEPLGGLVRTGHRVHPFISDLVGPA